MALGSVRVARSAADRKPLRTFEKRERDQVFAGNAAPA
jgi:hypothetical protein